MLLELKGISFERIDYLVRKNIRIVELMDLNWNQLIEKINLLQMKWESAF